MKANFSKKEIRSNLEAALINEIEKMEGSESSKKIKRVIRKVSKNIAIKIKMDMKKRMKKANRSRKLDSKNEPNAYLMENSEHAENGHS
ncbi:MAG: hypothetical protein WEB30_07560 [Cyclobacteriaceae bacterium]